MIYMNLLKRVNVLILFKNTWTLRELYDIASFIENNYRYVTVIIRSSSGLKFL